MKNLIIVMLIFCVACEPEFTIEDYIENSCIGDTKPRHTFYMSKDWPKKYHEEIADSIDEINSVFGIDLQLCGMVNGVGHDKSHVIVNADDSLDISTPRTVGHANSTKIYIWSDKMRHARHFRKVFLHEMGHYLYCNFGHTEGRENVMVQGWWDVTEYTNKDIDFILDGYCDGDEI